MAISQNEGTNFLKHAWTTFVKICGSRFKIEKTKPIEPEDLYCTNSLQLPFKVLDPDDPEWVESKGTCWSCFRRYLR